MRYLASPCALAALFCLALPATPSHATTTHPRKLTVQQHKPVKPRRIEPRHSTKPRVIVAPRMAAHNAVADPATADRVHAFMAAQHAPAEPAGAAGKHHAHVVAVAHHPKAHRPAVVRTAERTAAHAATPAVERPAAPIAEHPEPTFPPQAATAPVLLPTLYNKRGRLIVPPPLKGSHEILIHQNLVADRDGLARIQDDADLERMRQQGLLVALPASSALQVDERLPMNRRYARPWTTNFLTQLSREFYARFQTPLQVTSAVRTVEFQQHLIHINGNAAPAEGDTASPHLTGQAVDIAKHGLSMTQIAWMRGYLLPLVQEGKIDVEEEFQQSCFHISVYRNYVPQTSAPTAASRRNLAEAPHPSTADLAVSVR